MSKASWQIDWDGSGPPEPFSNEIRAYREGLGMEFGSLIPDDRLQAIADAWNDPSDIGRHRRAEGLVSLNLVALLDALTEDGP